MISSLDELIEAAGPASLLLGVNAKLEVTDALASKSLHRAKYGQEDLPTSWGDTSRVQREVKRVAVNGGEDTHEEGGLAGWNLQSLWKWKLSQRLFIFLFIRYFTGNTWICQVSLFYRTSSDSSERDSLSWTLPRSVPWIFARNRNWIGWLAGLHSSCGLSSDQFCEKTKQNTTFFFSFLSPGTRLKVFPSENCP